MNVKLYFHFGLYKTGSSFIQAICANNRNHLVSNGYYFPESIREDDMISGRISPGNGWGITDRIKLSDIPFCTKLIRKWKEQALKLGCNKILISDEALIHGFVSDNGLDCLIKAANNNQIVDLYCFAFLRDPVDHCLSTYKHRAKRGNIPDFKNWVLTKYETPSVLSKFHSMYTDFSINWKFSKYNRNGMMMAEIFFKKWLGIEVPFITKAEDVNASLTLSEISFLGSAVNNEKEIIPYLYEQLIRVPLNEKDNNKYLNLAYRKIAYEYLINFKGIFNSYNNLLSDGEKLALEPDSEQVPSSSATYSFSISQLNAIHRGFLNGNTISARWKRKLRRLKRFYRSTKSKLFR